MWPSRQRARVIQHEAWAEKVVPSRFVYYEKGGPTHDVDDHQRPKENQGCIDVKCILLILTNLAASESHIKTN